MREIVLDTETTGLEVEQGHRIIEIGALLLEDRKKTDDHFHVYLNPERLIDEEAQKVHGISNKDLIDKPKFSDIADEFLEFIKENQKKLDTPVILLTAKGEANERVEGLEVGADDYLPKPFEPKELLLRIQNIIRKTKKSDQKRVIQFENIKIDLNKQLIIKKNTEYKINNTEKKILEKMINNPGKTFSREDIGILTELDKERSIDVIITRLRKKIEIDPKNPKFLQTIRGAGYVLWIE